MQLDPTKPQPLKTDPNAPEAVEVVIRNPQTGETLFTTTAQLKHFSTGSVGYFAGGKMKNGEEKYQISCNIALVGSKPGK